MFEGVTDHKEFAQRLWTGDQDTYDFVWREVRYPLIAFLRARFNLSLEDAEDIVSLCWIKIRSSCCQTYDPSLAPFEYWLIAVTANLARDLMRDYEEANSTFIEDVEEALLISTDPARELAAVIDSVNDEEKSGDWRFELLEEVKRSARQIDLEAISLHYVHELTYSGMSRLLGISTAAAGMRVTRAVRRLRDEVKRLQLDEPRRRNKDPDEEDSS